MVGSVEQGLRVREDVDDRDIAEIVELAAELQSQAQADARRLSPAEVVEIAGELDIDSEHVEAAIVRHREARERARREAEAAEQAEAAAAARVRRMLPLVAVAVLGVVLVAMLFVGVRARRGAAAIEQSAAELAQAEAAVERVLERSVSAAPKQLALLGVRADALDEARSAYEQAEDLDARVAAARGLDEARALALAGLEPSDDEQQTQMRLNLHYELQGFDNRLATELGRLELARGRHEQVLASGPARLAQRLGWF